jgi:hypothetical protein
MQNTQESVVPRQRPSNWPFPLNEYNERTPESQRLLGTKYRQTKPNLSDIPESLF